MAPGVRNSCVALAGDPASAIPATPIGAAANRSRGTSLDAEETITKSFVNALNQQVAMVSLRQRLTADGCKVAPVRAAIQSIIDELKGRQSDMRRLSFRRGQSREMANDIR